MSSSFKLCPTHFSRGAKSCVKLLRVSPLSNSVVGEKRRQHAMVSILRVMVFSYVLTWRRGSTYVTNFCVIPAEKLPAILPVEQFSSFQSVYLPLFWHKAIANDYNKGPRDVVFFLYNKRCSASVFRMKFLF